MPRSENISSGVYRPKYKKLRTYFSLVSPSPRTRSRPGVKRIRQAEGRLSRPPQTALERSYLTDNSSSENRILRPRRQKTPDRIPEKQNDHIDYQVYIYIHTSVIRLSSGKLLDNLLQVAKRTNTPLIP